MKDFTILTVINYKFLNILKKTYPTWKLKKELQNRPTIILYTDLEPSELSFINAEKYEWDMEECTTVREKILSGFVYGAAKHVKTEYYLKIDADAFFDNDQPILNDNIFNYDIVGYKWRFTRPGLWIDTLDTWAETNKIPGNKYNTGAPLTEKRHGHRRLSSFFCMHRMDFVREAVAYSPNRMPVPSHDTYLWYMANRLPHRKWNGVRFAGLCHSKRKAMALPSQLPS